MHRPTHPAGPVSARRRPVQGCSRCGRLYSWLHVNRKGLLKIILPGLCLVLWVGTGCGGFNANVPVSPMWFIRQEAPVHPAPDTPPDANADKVASLS